MESVDQENSSPSCFCDIKTFKSSTLTNHRMDVANFRDERKRENQNSLTHTMSDATTIKRANFYKNQK